jgi:ketosteroid isomerase-like protein
MSALVLASAPQALADSPRAETRGTSSPLAAPAQSAHEDSRAVIDAIERMGGAYDDMAIDRIMAAYLDDPVVAFEPGRPISGTEQVREAFLASFAVKPKFRFHGHEVMVSGDTALHIAPWTMTGSGPGGEAISQSGLSVAVLRRQPDGRWLMTIDNPHGQRLISE